MRGNAPRYCAKLPTLCEGVRENWQRMQVFLTLLAWLFIGSYLAYLYGLESRHP